jgi:hypothetical protein
MGGGSLARERRDPPRRRNGAQRGRNFEARPGGRYRLSWDYFPSPRATLFTIPEVVGAEASCRASRIAASRPLSAELPRAPCPPAQPGAARQAWLHR